MISFMDLCLGLCTGLPGTNMHVDLVTHSPEAQRLDMCIGLLTLS